MVGGRTSAGLWGTASMTSSILLAAFLCNCRQAFSTYILLVSILCIHIAVLTRLLLGRKCFILSVRSDFHMSDGQLIAVHTFASRVLMSVSVDESLLPR